MINSGEIFLLFVVFHLKQYLGDFVLQTKYMLKKDAPDWGFFRPLFFHSLVHAAMTVFIVCFIDVKLWWLGAIDLILHFSMDRLKSSPKLLGRFNDITSDSYWRTFGFDQLIHNLTHVSLIWLALALRGG